MRIVAVIVLAAMLAAALWLLRPDLFQDLSQAPPDTVHGAGESASPARLPGAELPKAQPPAAQLPGAELPKAQPPAAQLPGAELPGGQLLPSRSQPIRETAPGKQATIAPSAPVADADADAGGPAAIEREARQYVNRLTRTEPAPVAAERADHFVSGEQILKLLPDSATQVTSLDQLARSSTLQPETPITVVRSVEQVEQVSPGNLIADSAGNLDAPVQQVLADESVRETTVRMILKQLQADPRSVIRVVRDVEYFEQTTPRELLSIPGADHSLPVKIVTGTHGLELTSVRELLPTSTLGPDTLFYVRTVRDTDVQGIWGIVHDGIIKNFARGIAIRRGRNVDTYQVDIPRDADELTSNSKSSFLGKLIFQKARHSYVYNLRENRMGRNPDRIIPGREIIIVDFEPDELIGIYKHFVGARG